MLYRYHVKCADWQAKCSRVLIRRSDHLVRRTRHFDGQTRAPLDVDLKLALPLIIYFIGLCMIFDPAHNKQAS
jgi:hypothetical protein